MGMSEGGGALTVNVLRWKGAWLSEEQLGGQSAYWGGREKFTLSGQRENRWLCGAL